MNASNAKDYLPLVQALADGKEIQVLSAGEWHDAVQLTTLSREANQYRIKPEPREIWVNHYEDGRYSIHLTVKDADDAAPDLVEYKQVRYREVIE